VLSLTAIGEVVAGMEIRRNGASPGDRIWVSGTIGDAFLGLAALRGGYPELPAEARTVLIGRFQLPEPRVELGPRLAGIAHAMLDVSDGLVADLGHICEASQVGASIALAQLPLSPAARQIAAETPDLPVRLATAGDDYELLFTTPPEASEPILRLSAELRLPLTAIGTIERGAAVRLVDADDNIVPVASAGYRHF
jgi:thiamine-monophosphate kinase